MDSKNAVSANTDVAQAPSVLLQGAIDAADNLPDLESVLALRRHVAEKCARALATPTGEKEQKPVEKGTMNEKSHMNAIRRLSTPQLLAAFSVPSMFDDNPTSEERFLRVLLERFPEVKAKIEAAKTQA